MGDSEFGLGGLLFALGPVVGSWQWAYNCTIDGEEGTMISYALATCWHQRHSAEINEHMQTLAMMLDVGSSEQLSSK